MKDGFADRRRRRHASGGLVRPHGGRRRRGRRGRHARWLRRVRSASTTTAGATIRRPGSAACTRVSTAAARTTTSTSRLTLADNHLEGTQALPVSMLGNPKQAYTWPDTTDNRLGFGSVNWQHAIDQTTIVAANAYFRQVKTSGVNSNVNGDYAPPADPHEAFNLFSDAQHAVVGRFGAGVAPAHVGDSDTSGRRRRRVRHRHDRFRPERATGHVRRRPRNDRRRRLRTRRPTSRRPIAIPASTSLTRCGCTSAGTSSSPVATTRRGSRRRTAPAKRPRSTARARTGGSTPPPGSRGPPARSSTSLAA